MKIRVTYILSFVFITILLACVGFGTIYAQEVVGTPMDDGRIDNFPGFRVCGKFFPYLDTIRPKVALVLSGGGSRGISQIGVLQEFEKAHIPIDMIIGSSMGSIIGGLYASGYSAEELDSIARSLNWNQILALSDAVSRSELFLQQKQEEEQSFLTLRLNGLTPVLPSSLASGQRLTTLLTKLVLNAPYHVIHSFRDLKIPFEAVATDMISGKRVVISSGDLAQAIRASSTVPVIFSPINSGSLELVDGGLISNIPVDVARDMGADIVIAVNTTSPLRSATNIDNIWDAVDQMTSITMQLSNKLQLEKADIVITPRLDDHLASDFTNLDSVIYQGKIAADSQLARIDSLYRLKLQQLNTRRTAMNLGTLNDSLNIQTDDSISITHPYYSNSLLLISNVKFEGDSLISDSVLIQPFNDLLSHYVTPAQINQSCEGLISIFRKADMGMARIERVDYDSITATLSIEINEGSIVKIALNGNTVAKSFLIRREFPLNANDLFITTKAIQGIDNIYSTGLFGQVLLSTSFDPLPILSIDVTEKSSRLLRFGLRVDNERNGQVSVSLSDEDLFGDGIRAGFSFDGGLRNRLGQFFFGTTRILNTDLTYNFSVFSGFQDVNVFWPISPDPIGEYRIIRNGYELSIGTQIKRFGTVSAALNYGWDKIKQRQNFNDTFSGRIVFLRIGSSVDTRDKSSFPNSGILSNIYFESSLKGLNSQTPFTKMYFDYETFQTAFSLFTFAQHYIFGFGDSRLPLSRQFDLGGEASFYGLRQDALVGRQIFLASWGLRLKLPFKLFFDTYLSGRFDIGDVWQEQSNIILKTLKQGIGISLGFDTPIGPASFSAGKAFYPEQSTFFAPWIFYFSVGVEIPTVSIYR
jgi:NTE family protein